MKKTKFLVLADPVHRSLEWERSLQETLGICHTCSKAYEIALFLAGITKPDRNYRKMLDLIKRNGVATVSQLEGEQRATIVVVKIY